eukprot:874234-Pleurochrysis_carterae.AAC.2
MYKEVSCISPSSQPRPWLTHAFCLLHTLRSAADIRLGASFDLVCARFSSRSSCEQFGARGFRTCKQSQWFCTMASGIGSCRFCCQRMVCRRT